MHLHLQDALGVKTPWGSVRALTEVGGVGGFWCLTIAVCALRAWGLVLVVASGLVCTGECPASILLRGEVPGVWR